MNEKSTEVVSVEAILDSNRRMAPHAELESIRLVELVSKLEDSKPENGTRGRLGVRTAFALVSLPEAAAKIEYISENFITEDGDCVRTEVRAAYVVRYQMNGTEHSEQDVHRFTVVNGLFNSWGYYRKLLAMIYDEMQIASSPLPLLTGEQAIHFSGLLSKTNQVPSQEGGA